MRGRPADRILLDMSELKQYLIPYFISNLLFAISVFAAWKKPIWARLFLAVLFLWAGCVNSSTVLKTPQVYLEYASLTPVSFYRNFINGFFSMHIRIFTLSIAVGQFLIFTGFILNRNWVRMACAGGVVFGLAIAPLGIGSAFPATVLMAATCLILCRKYDHDFIWNWHQYRSRASG